MAFDWAGWAFKVGSMVSAGRQARDLDAIQNLQFFICSNVSIQGAGVTLALLAALVYFQEKLVRGALAMGGAVEPERPPSLLPSLHNALLLHLIPQIYVPRLPGMPAAYQFFPAEFGLEHEDVWLSVPDGVRLHAWFMWLKGLTPEQRRRRPTVVFFQENAGNMSYR